MIAIKLKINFKIDIFVSSLQRQNQKLTNWNKQHLSDYEVSSAINLKWMINYHFKVWSWKPLAKHLFLKISNHNFIYFRTKLPRNLNEGHSWVMSDFIRFTVEKLHFIVQVCEVWFCSSQSIHHLVCILNLEKFLPLFKEDFIAFASWKDSEISALCVGIFFKMKVRTKVFNAIGEHYWTIRCPLRSIICSVNWSTKIILNKF